jgi:hypothetical protein
LAAGRARSVKEEGFFRELKAGKTTVDLLSLDASRIAGA